MPDGAVEKFFEIRNSFSAPDLEKGQKNFRLPSISRPQSISLALFLFNIGEWNLWKATKQQQVKFISLAVECFFVLQT